MCVCCCVGRINCGGRLWLSCVLLVGVCCWSSVVCGCLMVLKCC